MVLGAGDETPIGGIFAKFSERLGLSDAGTIAFHGLLKAAPVAAAIFTIEDGRLRVVARLGDPAPGGGRFRISVSGRRWARPGPSLLRARSMAAPVPSSSYARRPTGCVAWSASVTAC